jgi:streptogramin lyase
MEGVVPTQAAIQVAGRFGACTVYCLGDGASPSLIFWRYELQPWVVPWASTFSILSSSEVCAVTWQLPNRNQSYDLESPWIEVVSKGPIVAMSSDTFRFSQRETVADDTSIW